MNLVVDIGNSRIKFCLFENNTIVKQGVDTRLSLESLESFCAGFEIKNVIISSVSEGAQMVQNYFTARSSHAIVLEHSTRLPISNLYHSPETLGLDRISAAVGAYELFPCRNVLVIDCGTAITFDIINEKAQFIGGNISPGLNTRFKALHNYTNKLPLLESKTSWSVFGNETTSAIISGVQQGITFEINGYIDYVTSQYTNVSVVLTGGDADLFAKQLNHNITVDHYLVFKGLNRIVQYNAS